MTPDLIKRYSGAVPRYTSYPTANHFSAAVGPAQHRAWIAGLAPDADLSLYVHIPYCHELCWYCGCNTKATRKYQAVSAYMRPLLAEIAGVGERLPRDAEVHHIHWGGGSPSILAPDDIRRLDEATRHAFDLADDVEHAVEVDPRDMNGAKVAALAGIGITRISLGVQDFDDRVQKAINRLQSFELTQRVVDDFREAGVPSINIDLVYGLPHQTQRSVTETIVKVLQLRPDRIAIFGYAHIPSRIKHQRLIDDAALPDVIERFDEARLLGGIVTAAGYRQIGLDHFALPSDTMGAGAVRRNFQGYTTDRADALIGLGASAISQFPQGYVQNAVAAHDYAERVTRDGLAGIRGAGLSGDDWVRAAVIERLMCDFSFSAHDLRRTFGAAADAVLDHAWSLAGADQDGLVSVDDDLFRITQVGRPFTRTIAAWFDTYLVDGHAKHSLAI